MFMLVIVFRINICSNCNIGLQPTKSFFFLDPNSDLNYHFKMSFDPWVGKISSKREWLPTQCPCLENSMDRGAWQATVHGALKESDTTEQLPLSLHFFFTLRCLLHQEVFRRHFSWLCQRTVPRLKEWPPVRFGAATRPLTPVPLHCVFVVLCSSSYCLSF